MYVNNTMVMIYKLKTHWWSTTTYIYVWAQKLTRRGNAMYYELHAVRTGTYIPEREGEDRSNRRMKHQKIKLPRKRPSSPDTLLSSRERKVSTRGADSPGENSSEFRRSHMRHQRPTHLLIYVLYLCTYLHISGGRRSLDFRFIS